MVRFQLLSSRLHPGCQEHGPLAHSTCVTLWALLCLTRVVSYLDHLHLSPDGGLSPKFVISLTMVCTIALQWGLHLCLLSRFLCIFRWWWPRSHSLRTRLFSRPRPRLGRAIIDVQKVAQPGICSCLSIAVSVALLFWCTVCPRICERSSAVDVAFQSRQLPCGPGTRGFSTQLRSSIPQGRCALMCDLLVQCVSDSLNLFCDLPVSFQHAFSFSVALNLCSFGQGRLMMTGL